MGNITLLDILGSAVIAGFLLLMVYHSSARINETLFTSGNELVVQEQLVNLVHTMEEDLRRIGYCQDQMKIPDVSKAILAVNEHGMTFLTDVDNDATVDTIQYYIGSPGGLVTTPNPRDMMFYRKVNNSVLNMSIGLTKFDVKYFDIRDDSVSFPVSDPSLIHSLQIDLQLESTFPYDETFAYTAWRQLRLRTRNLRER